ncbi:homoprotocatechuate degradation operon regulator HpaR [Primorskyibacter flagellatus]|uniref:Homoprotocatechuate degradation operon regulator, HpaR n=1 Tax=Primorskyibacter flagellatus TaxID=1387277 RepID=A0A1W1ZDB4_9RHOB|nr:homoprotocatechuate degradation operon regulator HpaR [Primorskyibacter flagellatus]SMC46445.1 homoprotocatechuate degradation operon regulator, HpaR [Primorskyibacter flagellatus]
MNKTLPLTSRSLPILLIRAREAVMAPIRSMLADSGLTEQQWRVLRVLSEYGPQDTTDVADRASLLLPSLSRILRTMTEKGLITRQQHDGDRRRQILMITPAGQAVIDENIAEAAAIADAIKARLGDENYEALLDLLDLVTAEQKSQTSK